MNASTKTRTALRAALKQEDAAITERLREDVQTAVGELLEKVPQPTAVASEPEVGPQEVAAAQTRNTQPAKVVRAKVVKAKELVPAATRRPAARSRSGKPAPRDKPATAETVATAAMKAEPIAPTEGKATKKAGGGGARATAPATEIAARKAPVKSAAVKLSDAKKEKPEKVVRDSFSMPASEHRQIKALRERLGRIGRLSSKSEVLRAGLFLLGERSDEELVALLDGLPPVAKGKRSKKH